MVELSPSNLITLLSLIVGAFSGWSLREFSIINKQHDNLSRDVNKYMDHTDETITDIKVDVGKIQVSIRNIEEMIKSERR